MRLAADFIKWVGPLIPTSSHSSHSPDSRDSPDSSGSSESIKLLDLCCGTGMVAFEALDSFMRTASEVDREVIVHGVDISSVSLEIARRKARNIAAKAAPTTTVQFFEGSAVDLDALPLLGKGSYGLVTCCSAFVFMPGERAGVLRGWKEYLMPGGVLIFDVPAPETQVVSLFVGRALESVGLPTIERDWVTGLGSMREIMVEAELEVVGVFETGSYKERRYGMGDGELGQVWERSTASEMSGLGSLGMKERETAKGRFVEMMRGKAKEGVVKDEYRLVVGVGRKRA